MQSNYVSCLKRIQNNQKWATSMTNLTLESISVLSKTQHRWNKRNKTKKKKHFQLDHHQFLSYLVATGTATTILFSFPFILLISFLYFISSSSFSSLQGNSCSTEVFFLLFFSSTFFFFPFCFPSSNYNNQLFAYTFISLLLLYGQLHY